MVPTPVLMLDVTVHENAKKFVFGLEVTTSVLAAPGHRLVWMAVWMALCAAEEPAMTSELVAVAAWPIVGWACPTVEATAAATAAAINGYLEDMIVISLK
jgi:hypothetical protein